MKKNKMASSVGTSGGIEIETGIPIPPSRGTTASYDQYPFGSMEVGNSFFIPCQKPEKDKIQTRLIAAAIYYAKKRSLVGWKFATRQLVHGVRCWRVA